MLEFQEVSDFFKNISLSESDYEAILDYMESQGIDILQMKEPVEIEEFLEESGVEEDVSLQEENGRGEKILENLTNFKNPTHFFILLTDCKQISPMRRYV